MQVEFRPGDASDLGWLLEAQVELYQAEHGYGDVFERYVARSFDDAALHRDARDRVWIAEAGGRRVGAIALVNDPGRPGWAKLRWYLVTRPARGHGIGARLLDAAMAHAAQTGYEGVSLWTCSDLEAARRQYERHGFRLVEEDHCPWKDGIVQQRFEAHIGSRAT